MSLNPHKSFAAVSSSHGGHGWLHAHLNDFVLPILGSAPEAVTKKHFTPHEMAVLKNIWRSTKRVAKGRQILLAGRDVWLFEVLARRENFPTTFIPVISRLTASHIKGFEQHFLLDTGFAGSIPRALGCKRFLLGSAGVHNHNHQVFPNMKGARSLILKLEATPKYWKRGFMKHEDGCASLFGAQEEDYCVRIKKPCDCIPTISQEFSEPEEFVAAARLTVEIYKDSSPAFVEGRLTTSRWQGLFTE